jgi:CheY-like chemotaxis protein
MIPVAVHNGQQALEALERAGRQGNPFRLMLLDYLMPAMDGYAVASRVRKLWPAEQLKIIVLTSANPTETSGLADEYQISAHVMKPYGQSDLRAAVNRSLFDLDRTPPTAPTSDATFSPLGRPLSILLAEDNLINQKLVLTLLRKHGHEIDVAENGREAVAAHARKRYDVILMDVQMPEMNGFEATGAIREREASIGMYTPIVAVTARAMEGDREQCYEAGMDDYVSKPIQFDQLFEVVTRVVGSDEPSAPDAAPQDHSGDGAPPAQEPAIDQSALLAVLDGDDELLGEILTLFNATCHRDLEAILKSVEARNAEQLALTAHKLKGAVGNLCARPAFTLLEKLEHMGRANDLTDVDHLAAALRKEIDRIGDALYQLAERQSHPTRA